MPFLYSGSLIICSGPRSPLGDLGVKITTCRGRYIIRMLVVLDVWCAATMYRGPTVLLRCIGLVQTIISIGVEIKKEVMF